EPLHARRQGHRPLDDRAGALGGVDDLERRLVDQFVVERLEADPDLLLGSHGVSFKERCGLVLQSGRGSVRGRAVLYSRIFATTPAPTVLPPSRMAKRSPSSMAIGAISLTVMETLS